MCSNQVRTFHSRYRGINGTCVGGWLVMIMMDKFLCTAETRISGERDGAWDGVVESGERAPVDARGCRQGRADVYLVPG